MKPQLIPSQVATALTGTGHGVQELPQLVGSVSPTQTLPQRWKPTLHRKPQPPAVHVAVALAGAVQAIAQEPHAVGSVCTSTQRIPQRVGRGSAQPEEHAKEPGAPPQRGVLPEHMRRHAPQSVAAERSVSQPLAGSVSQSSKPGSQVKVQVVPSQPGVACAGLGHGVHAVPQAVTARSDTQVPRHEWKPVLQVEPQSIPSQVAVALEGTGHGVQELPQLSGSRFSTQLPEQAWKP